MNDFTFRDGGRLGLPPVDSLPTLGVSDRGQMRFLNTDEKPYFWNGTSWQVVGSDAGGMQPLLFRFDSPSNNWVINHNRGYAPVFMAVDSTDTEVLGDAVHTAGYNTLTISWNGPFSGRVYVY